MTCTLITPSTATFGHYGLQASFTGGATWSKVVPFAYECLPGCDIPVVPVGDTDFLITLVLLLGVAGAGAWHVGRVRR